MVQSVSTALGTDAGQSYQVCIPMKEQLSLDKAIPLVPLTATVAAFQVDAHFDFSPFSMQRTIASQQH